MNSTFPISVPSVKFGSEFLNVAVGIPPTPVLEINIPPTPVVLICNISNGEFVLIPTLFVEPSTNNVFEAP